VRAHRLILGLASPAFAAMFDSPMAEGRDSGLARIDLSDLFSTESVKVAVRYCYTGVVNDGSPSSDVLAPPLRPTNPGVELVCESLRAADYLQLQHLKETLEVLLVSWDAVSLTNCCALLQVAQRAECTQLQGAVITFMREMHDVVSLQPEYAAMDGSLRDAIADLTWTPPTSAA